MVYVFHVMLSFVLFLFSISKIDAVVTKLGTRCGAFGLGLAESVQMSQVWGFSQPRYAKGGIFLNLPSGYLTAMV